MGHKRKRFNLTSEVQKTLMWLVFLAMFLPSLIFGGSLYYVLENVYLSQIEGKAWQPEFLINQIVTIILFTIPITILLCWVLGVIVTNKIVGPLERISKELDQVIEGKKKSSIVLRPNDKMVPFVQKINRLIEGFLKDKTE